MGLFKPNIRKLDAKGDINGLVRALKYEDWEVYEKATKALVNIGGSAMPSLIEALKDKDNFLRRRAIEVIRKIRPEFKVAVPALIETLRDDYSDFGVRDSAVRALEEIGPEAKEAVPVLIGILRDIHIDVYAVAARALVRIDVAAVPALIEALHHQETEVRVSVARILRDIGPEAKLAVPALVEALEDKEPRVREAAARALSKIGPKAKVAMPALIKALQDKDSKVRDAAAIAIGGKVSKIQSQIKRLKGRDWSTRHSGVEGLARIGEAAVPALLEALNNKDYRVRQGAAEALGKIGPSAEAVPSLIKLLKDEKGRGVKYAVEALGKIGPDAETAVPVLLQLLIRYKDSISQLSIADNLAAIGKAAVPGLIELLQDEDDELRERATEILGKIGPDAEAAVPALMEMLEYSSSLVIYAHYALAKITDKPRGHVTALLDILRNKQYRYLDYDHDMWVGGATRIASFLGEMGSSVTPALIEALNDEDYFVRKSAAEAFGEIGDKAAIPALTRALKDKDEDVRWLARESLKKLRRKVRRKD